MGEHGQDAAMEVAEERGPSWRQRFRRWRRTRPFWAGVFTALAGLWLIWSPQAAIGGLSMTIGIVTDGWLIGALLIILGIGMWAQPAVRGILGAMAIVLALGSFIKINFGGFLFGMLLGLVGGAMAIAWMPDQPADEADEEPDEQDLDQPSTDQLLPMGDRTANEAGQTQVSLLAAVALVPALVMVLALGVSGIASGQEGSPTPTASPSASSSEPPSPTPTPSPSEPVPEPSPTAAPTTATPTATPSAPPTSTPRPDQIRAGATDPQPAGMTGRLTADSSTLTGLQFVGIVTYQTAHGTVQALRFAADTNRLNDMMLAVTIRGVTTTIRDGSDDTSVLSGDVVIDVTRFAGTIPGHGPVEFTPAAPPPQLPDALQLTDVSADLLLVQADDMSVPNMTQELS
ncbi:MAG: DUF6114 domain-containing protein [Sporichthyaceae bacterium]|nr:DUF6114 domain-containing protein [Sporichthyaceae bacterium]